MGQIRWTEASAHPQRPRPQPSLSSSPFQAHPVARDVRFPGPGPPTSRLAGTDRRAMSGDLPVSDELVLGLKCRLCGKLYGKEALNFCTEDFGPLEVVYDYEAVGRTLTREAI